MWSFQSAPITKKQYPVIFTDIAQKYWPAWSSMCKQKFHLFLQWKCYNLVLVRCEISVQFCIEYILYLHLYLQSLPTSTLYVICMHLHETSLSSTSLTLSEEKLATCIQTCGSRLCNQCAPLQDHHSDTFQVSNLLCNCPHQRDISLFQISCTKLLALLQQQKIVDFFFQLKF